MTRLRSFSHCFSYFGLLMLLLSAHVSATDLASTPPNEKKMGLTGKLGTQVSIDDLEFRNEKGENVRLSRFFNNGKPVLLNIIYYRCPSLCSFVLNGLVDGLQKLEWTPGGEFEVVTVSINHRESPALARKKKKAYFEKYGRAEAEAGWHFLTGSEENVLRLTREVGFNFEYDETSGEYGHGAGIYVLTPDGKISRILYGIEYSKKDLKLALLEASNGKVGSVIDKILLFCYRYDPDSRGYSLYVFRVVQAGSAGMVFFLFGYLFMFWRRQKNLDKEDLEQRGVQS